MTTRRTSPEDEETAVYPVAPPARRAPSVEIPRAAVESQPQATEPRATQTLPPPAPPAFAAPPSASWAPSTAPAPGTLRPSVAPPLYPAYRGPRYPTTGRVVFAGVVLLVYGAIETMTGAVGAVFAGTFRRAINAALREQGVRFEPSVVSSVIAGFFVALLLIGVLHFVAAGGVFAHRNWARVLGSMLALLGIAGGALLLTVVVDPGRLRPASLVAPLAIIVPYFAALLGLVFAGDHFRRRW